MPVVGGADVIVGIDEEPPAGPTALRYRVRTGPRTDAAATPPPPPPSPTAPGARVIAHVNGGPADLAVSDRLVIGLGRGRGELVVQYCGRGASDADLVVWLPRSRTLFAGALVAHRAVPDTGAAYHVDWSTTTLDQVAAFGATTLVCADGAVLHGAEVGAAIDHTRGFLTDLLDRVGRVHLRGGGRPEAVEAARTALASRFGDWPGFDAVLPGDAARVFDELSGVTATTNRPPARPGSG